MRAVCHGQRGRASPGEGGGAVKTFAVVSAAFLSMSAAIVLGLVALDSVNQADFRSVDLGLCMTAAVLFCVAIRILLALGAYVAELRREVGT